MRIAKTKQDSPGFTIIELMVALSVLAVLLLICTLVLMNLGKMYVKGNNQADAQSIARSVVDDITNQVQLGGAAPDLVNQSSGWICIGTTHYSFVVGKQVVSGSPGPDQTNHALWRDTMNNGICPTNAAAGMDMGSGNGVELIPDHMRLVEFQVTPTGVNSGLYDISVGIAYGDSDLLCNSNAGSDCSNPSNPNHLSNLEANSPGIQCINGVGNQFCGVSYLSTTVARRLPNE